ncbi:ABC transporter permease subunit [bacterium]|uniref:Uncharacterized protein n=1 Tax=candidate division WWE3 bacterium CG22_combo_CG10-13_8_21_14_all_39_12 TaxID=1975094 RepID=A0A2H0BFA8_UNCKA|nr:ABC transporter permease subunit [bacterium]PIP56331.1 MAG: hypothetical protein COX05_03625 [candidate division WWE3 bacterium CG22_combo_CG10-13_8_21_14_all_39_12]
MNTTLLRKELKLYTILISNYLVFGVTLGIVLFLFFNSFYAVNSATLDGLFGLFPWLFALVVPAFAMGSIAAERKTSTLDLLFAHPVSEWTIIVWKVVAQTIVMGVFAGVTIIIPFVFSNAGTFDWGVIYAAYGATFLLILFFVSINTLLSSLTTNQFAAFLMSFVANLLLILMGTAAVDNLLPSIVIPFAIELSPVEHFVRLSSGNIRFADILYFIFIAAGSVSFAVFSLSRLRGRRVQGSLLSEWTVRVIGMLFIIGAIFSHLIPGALDVTGAQVFTLSNGAVTIIGNIDQDVKLKLYTTRKLPPAFKPRLDDIQRVLSGIARTSDKVTFESLYPKDNQEMIQELSKKGIVSRQFTVVSQTELSAQEGFLGLEIVTDSDSRVIPYIEQTSDFEFQVMSLIHELTNSKDVNVDYVTEGDQSAAELLGVLLPSQYVVTEHGVNETDLTGDIIIFHDIKTELTQEYIGFVSSLVSQGSSLLVFDNGVNIDLQTGQATAKESLPINSLLINWDISLNTTLMSDSYNNSLVQFNSGYGTVVLPYPLWPVGMVSQDVPLFTGIETIELPWISPVTIGENAKRFETLVKTSPSSGELNVPFSLSPNEVPSVDSRSSKPVVVLKSRGTSEGGVVVIGSATVLSETFAARNQNNALFLGNVIEIMSQDRSLAEIRSKNRIPPSLTFESANQKQNYRYGIMIGVPGIIIVVGSLVWYRRRQIAKRIYLG